MSARSAWLAFAAAFTFASTAALDANAHSGNTVDGTLIHQVGNPNPKLGGNMRSVRNFYVISEDDNHVVPVDLSAAQLPSGGVNRLLKQRVRVTAAADVNVQTLPRTERVRAQRVERLAGGPQPDVFPMAGSRQYISLLCKWGDDANEPRTYTFFQNQLGNSYPGFNHYFQEVSHGRADITGSNSMTAWVSLPQARSFYYTAGDTDGSYLSGMAQACITAAESQVNFTAYEGVNLMFNGLVDDCCAWGGSAFLTLEGVSRVVSVTWMPYWGEPPGEFGWLDHGVLGHELSHSFGSPHSGDPSGYQYGNYWDVVSRPAGTCATYDATYGCLSQHPVGDNKIKMDFIPPARLATHAVGAATTTYTLERMANPPLVGGTYQLLKILTPDAHKYFTVEARLRTGYDVNIPGDGVIIMEVIDNRPFVSPTNPGDDARLLTPTGTTAANTGDIDSRWSAGDSYIHVGNNIKITVVSFDGVSGNAQIKVEPATAPGEYSFALADYAVTEGGPQVTVNVNRTAPFTAAGYVTWTTANGTAIAGQDFGTAGNAAQRTGQLYWPAGTGGAKTITLGLPASNVPVINEGTAESAENFTINLSNPIGGVLGAQVSTTVTVNDGAVIYFGALTTEVGETGGNVNVQVLRSGNLTGTNAVTYSTIAGTALATSDFTNTTGMITFAPGEDTKTISVGSTMVANPHIHVVDDATIEGPETFTIRLSLPTNGAIVPNALKDNVVTINSNENGVAFGVDPTTFTEGAGLQNLTVVRSGGAGAVTVNYAFTNGTAVNGTHFDGTNGQLSWADGVTGAQNISFTINDDALVNSARSFTIVLSGAIGASIVAPLSKAVTINDNDNTVQFTTPTIAVMENGTLTLTVSRLPASGASIAAPASVTWTTVDGTAVAGTDFGTNGVPVPVTGSVSWLAGQAGSKTFTVPLINDAVPEAAKTFTIQLSAPTGTTLGLQDDITVTLNDDEKTVFFSSPTYSVTETTEANVLVKIKRGGLATAAASATWKTTNGTAVSGIDFGVLNTMTDRTGTVSWAIGDVAEKTITIPILSNTSNEPNKTFTVEITSVTGGLIEIAPDSTTVTIIDDDIPPQSLVKFSAPKYVVIEGTPTVQLTLQRILSGDPTQSFANAASVKYSTVAGSALAVSDYTAQTNVTVNWAGGDNGDKTFNIPIINNTTAEPPEYFKVTLSQMTGAMGLGSPGEAYVWIMDDDEVFPPDGVMPTSIEMADGVTTGWHVSNDPGAYEGQYTLRSDFIDPGQSAGIKMDGTFAGGNVSFRVKISSEANFDTLKFYINGVLQTTWSGTSNTAWQMSPTYVLAPGPYILQWIYSKDGSIDAGQDAAWIDSLVTPAFTP